MQLYGNALFLQSVTTVHTCRPVCRSIWWLYTLNVCAAVAMLGSGLCLSVARCFLPSDCSDWGDHPSHVHILMTHRPAHQSQAALHSQRERAGLGIRVEIPSKISKCVLAPYRARPAYKQTRQLFRASRSLVKTFLLVFLSLGWGLTSVSHFINIRQE